MATFLLLPCAILAAPSVGKVPRERKAHHRRTERERKAASIDVSGPSGRDRKIMRNDDRDNFDYVVVGGGSAGCVLAARLSEDPSCRVLLIEAGGRDWNPVIHVPLGVGVIRQQELFDWGFVTEPQPHLFGRRVEVKRGKVLGGSSSINFMAHNRGAKCDFDRWVALGATEWSHEALLPYFKQLETWHGAPSQHRGTSGPTHVQYTCTTDPLGTAILEAAAANGQPICDDLNGPDAVGFGLAQSAIHNGKRASASRAYLAPIRRSRRNLNVVTRAHVTKVNFRGSRATGVQYRHKAKLCMAYAGTEVILSAGAFNTPHILMLSGVGEAAALRHHDIEIVQDLPGVGKNLQDHLSVPLTYKRIGPEGPLHRMLRIDRLAVAIVQATLMGRGPATVLPSGVNAILKSRPDVETPDLQMLFGAGAMEARAWFPHINNWEDLFYLRPILARPESRGEVRLRSPDPLVPPSIDPSYLSTDRDVATLCRGFEIARDVARQRAIDPFRGEELIPGAGCQSPDDIEFHVRCTATTVQHAACTCRMGTDPLTVVDQALRVHGLDGIRVVDASVMPEILGCNINATVLAMAERASDVIRGRTQ